MAGNYLEIQRSNFVICHQRRRDPGPLAPTHHPPDNGHGAKNIQTIFRREESEEQNKHSPGWVLLFVAFYALLEGVKGMRQ